MFAIICSLFISMILISYRKTLSLNICVINCCIWAFLSVSVCLMDLQKSFSAFFFVLVCTFSFTVCYILLPSRVRIRGGASLESEESRIDLLERRFGKVNAVVCAISVLATLYLAITLGYSLSTFASASSLMTRMNAISHLRYSGEAENLPIINRFVNSLAYACCGYSGFYIVRRFKKMYAANILVIVFQTVLTNTKATLVFGVAFYVAGIMTGMNFFHKRVRAKHVLIVMGGLVGITLFSTGIDYFRHRGELAVGTELNRVMVSYIIGPYSAFSVWFERADKHALDFGLNTFGSVFRFLGITAHKHGEFVRVGNVETNVYTIFKHLVNDYSLFGTVVTCGVFGFLSGIVDKEVRNNRETYVGISIVMLSCILTAFFSSIFRYNVNIFACILIVLACTPRKIVIGKGR